MSKRSSTGPKNSILNYFQSLGTKSSPRSSPSASRDKEEDKQPQENGTTASIEDKTPKTPQTPKTTKPSKQPKRKRPNVIDSDSDSDDDKLIKKSKNGVKSDDEVDVIKPKTKHSRIKDDSSDDDDEEEPQTSKRQKLKKSTTSQKSAKKEQDESESKKTLAQPKDLHSNWLHNRLEFLQPEKIRDKKGNRPEDPDYDYRTLWVPESFLNQQTPAMRQWWILKSEHMDSVIFFKVGKFYELYHMDAVVGVIHLGFSYMKGDFAHSGFPESAYHKMAHSLISKGFKVARTEQTETPEMMSERCKKAQKSTKFDKVVRREICQITTKASCVYSAQLPEAGSANSFYMYAITEKDITGGEVRFGVTFIDTSIGTFHMTEFDDDMHFSKLLVLMAEYPPGLLLLERLRVSPMLKTVTSTYVNEVRKEHLSPEQFYSAQKTIELLNSGSYFVDKNNKLRLPEFLKEITNQYDPKPDCELMLKALGACLWFLQDSKLDIQVVSMGKFERYNPFSLTSKEFMILDSVCMKNLKLLGELPDSLQKVLDHCQTAFGKRLLTRWICRPSCDLRKIRERQEAVKEFYENDRLLQDFQNLSKRMPDLERQIAKIHTCGNKHFAKNHPDSRAIFYESTTYSKRRINDLLTTLNAFEANQKVSKLFRDCKSTLLRRLTQYQPVGINENLEEILEYFEKAFDQKQAKETGKIIPLRGVDETYDEAVKAIERVNKELDDYLNEQRRFFKCQVNYFGAFKNRYQLEIPETHAKKVTKDYQLEGTRKGAKPVKRYSTPETKQLLAKMVKAEAERDSVVLDLNRQIYERFSEHGEKWNLVIQCFGTLDVLASLAAYAKECGTVCIPIVHEFDEKPKIVVENGRHPCVVNIDNFVPNDMKMGVENFANILLLTGPNMGGKSTLMRQIAVISIMAQIGSYVPASKCELSLIDRIFTRLGGYDDIIGGSSTFLCELSEASSVLQHATSNSLVVLDELGRGTSTHDGNAIATAYVKKLLEMKCRSLFSTHYHTLVDCFRDCDDIQLGHMACVVENDEDPTQESVTFLYKMAPGRCPKSYGFNVARLAGLDLDVIVKGRQFANDLEKTTNNRNVFKQFLVNNDLKSISEALKSLKVS